MLSRALSDLTNKHFNQNLVILINQHVIEKFMNIHLEEKQKLCFHYGLI